DFKRLISGSRERRCVWRRRGEKGWGAIIHRGDPKHLAYSRGERFELFVRVTCCLNHRKRNDNREEKDCNKAVTHSGPNAVCFRMLLFHGFYRTKNAVHNQALDHLTQRDGEY